MTPSLLTALSRVLASIDALRNLRALYALLAGFCTAGLLLAMAQSALVREQNLLSAVWMGLALAVAFFGVNATGLMLMDQARGLPVRDPQDAFADALHSAHRVLLALLACVAAAGLAALLLAGLLWATRLPGVGAPLLAIVLPAGVLLLGGISFALVILVGPLAGPAVWAGRRSAGVLAFLRGRLRHGLPETALLMAAVYLLAALATAAVSFVVVSGGRFMAGLAILGAGIELPAGQLLAGVMGLGPRGLGARGVPLQGGSLGLAALIGGGVVFAIALVLPTLVWLRGCCAVYLALTDEE
ncbi:MULTISPECIES: hypothetical protein [unclassified Roseateles]|uniref:hypothetical protein n=1 Tax=unclassified Roseateles TaxID=2626991 RepID=UPI0006F24F2E|nr:MULTISPECIES: hypothetical protein [unclassified Roseateles]KQW46423.1 hypothetical protein ASC81_08440 [Pelomonas sp. Root405]KRA73473.1 hypothetical protein ASD88_08440 [Pelomonas sp. Root662]